MKNFRRSEVRGLWTNRNLAREFPFNGHTPELLKGFPADDYTSRVGRIFTDCNGLRLKNEEIKFKNKFTTLGCFEHLFKQKVAKSSFPTLSPISQPRPVSANPTFGLLQSRKQISFMFDRSRILLQVSPSEDNKYIRIVLSFHMPLEDGYDALTADCYSAQEFRHWTEGLIDRLREVQGEGYKFFENLRKRRGW